MFYIADMDNADDHTGATNMPNTTTPAEWHAYIQAAPNFAAAQTRMEQAIIAGVDFFALEKFHHGNA